MFRADRGAWQERILVFGAEGDTGADLMSRIRLRGAETYAFAAGGAGGPRHRLVHDAIRERNASGVLYVLEPSLGNPGGSDHFVALVSAVGNAAHAASSAGAAFVLAAVPRSGNAFETAISDAAERLVRKLHASSACFRAAGDGETAARAGAEDGSGGLVGLVGSVGAGGAGGPGERSSQTSRKKPGGRASEYGPIAVREPASPEAMRRKTRERWWEGDGIRLSDEGLITWLLLAASKERVNS